jgi:hypothetical protein
LPPVVDKPCTKEHVELARGLFQSAEEAFAMTHLRRSIREAKGLADVHVPLDKGVEERSVDIKMTHLKVVGGRDGEEEAKDSHADDGGERIV